MKKYWFHISSNTFLWVSDEKGLVYNTDNYVQFKFENIGLVKEIVNKLNNIESLYCVLITEDELKDNGLHDFIDKIVKTESGNIVEYNIDVRRPIALKPESKVRDGINYYKWQHNNGIDGEVIDNLHELIFYINGSPYGSDYYYKQTIYPLNTTNTLHEDKILSFASNSRRSHLLSKISLIGNIWEYPNYTKLIDSLIEQEFTVNLYCIDKDLLNSKTETCQLPNSEQLHLHIIITDHKEISEILSVTSSVSFSKSYVFHVTSEEEYEQSMMLIENLNLEDVEIIPLYNKNNIDFFKEYIYTTEDDISNFELSKREVFIRQTLNIQSFGKLYILPDESVYANVNNHALGNINDEPKSIVYKEFTDGVSWLQIRKEEPCCNCIYQWLCAPPSNYELAIGKDNLCTVKP